MSEGGGWEYKSVVVKVTDLAYFDPADLAQTSVMAAFNAAGTLGWELVSASVMDRNGMIFLTGVFKRPEATTGDPRGVGEA